MSFILLISRKLTWNYINKVMCFSTKIIITTSNFTLSKKALQHQHNRKLFSFNNGIPIQITLIPASNLRIAVVNTTKNFKSTNVDSIEAFTNQLIEENLQKWDNQKSHQQNNNQENKKNVTVIIEKPEPPEEDYSLEYQTHRQQQTTIKSRLQNHVKILKELPNLNERDFTLENLQQNHIDNLLLNTIIHEPNVCSTNFILKQCIKYNKCPSESRTLELLEYLSERVDCDNHLLIIRFIEMCRLTDFETFQRNANFEYFIGRVLWVQGNADVSLALLKSIYEQAMEKKYTKSMVYKIFQRIVIETLENRSEAVLIALTRTAIEFHFEFNDVTVLQMIWKQCFLSYWFSDQQFANDLFDKYENIQRNVGRSTSLFTYNLLIEHNLDAMYRLIELYLKYDMKAECKQCLEILFDYQFWRKDLRACSAIIQNSLNLNMPLSEVYSKKLIKLLLGKNYAINNNKKNENVTPKFQFKF